MTPFLCVVIFCRMTSSLFFENFWPLTQGWSSCRAHQSFKTDMVSFSHDVIVRTIVFEVGFKLRLCHSWIYYDTPRVLDQSLVKSASISVQTQMRLLGCIYLFVYCDWLYHVIKPTPFKEGLQIVFNQIESKKERLKLC